MPFPKRICAVCSEEFELRPDKPGFANRCPECTAAEEEAAEDNKQRAGANDAKGDRELNAERRKAIRDLLYRKDS
jgi:hypothetical protein